MERRKATGEYNEIEYAVFVGGREVYSAGNHPGDSTLRVPAGKGVGRREMRRFCALTTRDIAKERGVKYGGVEYVPHPDSSSIPG
jgi:hypothetical protein